MEASEKTLNEVYTMIARVQGEIISDLYLRHSFSPRRSVSYRQRLTRAVQLLEKLEQINER
jgi:hypothetical protein